MGLFHNYFVCWQAWRGTRQEFAVAMNKGFCDVGLRKQHLGCQRSWVCWYFILRAWFWILYCFDFGSAYWR